MQGASYSLSSKFKDSACLDSADTSELPLHSLTLTANEVHVWQATLDDRLANSLKLLLSEDETLQANRFRFAKDRNHFVVARGLLRKLLASYLRIHPAELRFSYAENGKPYLKGSRRTSINFNLAHSHNLAIYAFSQSRELGVDVEFMREDLEDGQEIAERFFSSAEIKALRSVPAELTRQVFFNCWTRKEAYIKARGEGLSIPLDVFDVSLLPGEPAALLWNHKDPGEVTRWSMRSLPVLHGYVATLVVEGHDWQLKTFGVEQLQK